MTLITVYLNVSESRTFPREHAEWLRQAVEVWLVAFGPCEVVTMRPDRYPGSYIEVRYGPTLGFYRQQSLTKVASLSTVRLLDTPGLVTHEWYSHVLWHDEAFVKAPDGQPPHALIEGITWATVHEFAHALGWPVLEGGRHYPPELSPEWWVLTKSNHQRAAANLAIYHQEARDVT